MSPRRLTLAWHKTGIPSVKLRLALCSKARAYAHLKYAPDSYLWQLAGCLCWWSHSLLESLASDSSVVAASAAEESGHHSRSSYNAKASLLRRTISAGMHSSCLRDGHQGPC